MRFQVICFRHHLAGKSCCLQVDVREKESEIVCCLSVCVLCLPLASLCLAKFDSARAVFPSISQNVPLSLFLSYTEYTVSALWLIVQRQRVCVYAYSIACCLLTASLCQLELIALIMLGGDRQQQQKRADYSSTHTE